jgi:hypothetical protein
VSPQSNNDRIPAHPEITPTGEEEGTLHTGTPPHAEEFSSFLLTGKDFIPASCREKPLLLLMETTGKSPDYLMVARYCQRNIYRIAGKIPRSDQLFFLKK